mgnify:FL=1
MRSPFKDAQASLRSMNAERVESDLGVAANDPMLKRVQQFHAFIATPKGRRLMEEIQKNAVEVAREELFDKLDQGVTCPCCGQFAKRYKRKLNSSMAAALCWMWAHARDAWIEVPLVAPSWVLKAREYPKLAWWGLIEEKPRQEGSKARTSGVWRVTPLGAEFVRGCSDVAMYAFVYNGEVQDFTDRTTDIRHALGDRFDYAELMGFDR